MALTGLVITGNTADRGGGLAIATTTYTLTASVIAGNTAYNEAGGLYTEDATGAATFLVFHGNNGQGHGDALWIASATLTVLDAIPERAPGDGRRARLRERAPSGATTTSSRRPSPA